jgi:GlpG protein
MQYIEMLNKLGAPTLRDPYAEPMWKFLTTCFVHGSMMHILFNMMWLFQLGPLMERGIGTAKTVLFVVATAFISSAISTAIEGRGVGMSGVVYALCGFMWTAWPRWTGFLEKFNGQTVKLMIFWQLLCFVLSYTGAMNIANFAHISGMAYGALIGKWACAGNKHGKQWMAATIAFTLFGIACAFKPLGAWLSF